jgi:UDP-N-acetylmuramate dehydrogenase
VCSSDPKEELGLAYRTNKLSKDYIFVKALFKLQKSQKEYIKARMEEIAKQRESTQPVRVKTGGSTFKNPKNSEYKAWQLVDKSGLRGYRIGDAQISEKHCNFMLNLGNATASDLESLGEFVIDRVYKDSGIMLEWEIKRIGY